MRVSASLVGADALSRSLRALAQRAAPAAGAGLVAAGEVIAERAAPRVPVATGALRDSLYVSEPAVQGDMAGAEVGIGGSGMEYAVAVHEDLGAVHDDGEAKFLERAILGAGNAAAPALAGATRRTLVTGNPPPRRLPAAPRGA